MKARIVGCGGFALSVALALWARPVSAEPYVLIKVIAMDRTTANQVMSATDFKEFEKTIQTEKKYFQDAVREAAKAWREDAANKNTTFAGGRLIPRSIVGSPERFENQEKAEAQLGKYEERETKKEREKAKAGMAAKSKDEADREKKKEAEVSSAMDLVKTKLAELMAGKTGAPEAGAPAAADAEKKADPKANEKSPAVKPATAQAGAK